MLKNVIYLAAYTLICAVFSHNFSLKAIRGSDYYDPKAYSPYIYLYSKFRDTSHQYNYQEYFLPVLDYYEIFAEKLEDSDSLMDVYRLQDKSGRELALRPEITPQLCKLISEKWHEYKERPLRWYTIADCWRYERPCAGRRRNHQQWNLDIIGSNSPNTDSEPLLILIQTFQSLGLTHDDVKISISSTELPQELLSRITSDTTVSAREFRRVLDKFSHFSEAEFKKLFLDLGFETSEYNKLMEFLSMSNKTLLKEFPNEKLEAVLNLFTRLSLEKWINIDLSITRGNDYYNGIVYEAYDKQAKRRAIAGGGHYQIRNVSGGNMCLECSGFGMGNIVLFDILKERQEYILYRGKLPEQKI